MSETTKEPTFPKKMVSLNVAVALGIVCILLIAGLGGAIAMTINDKDNQINSANNTISQLNATIADKNNTIASLNVNITNLTNEKNQLQAWLDGNKTLLSQTQTWLSGNITSYEAQISSLNARINQLQTWLSGNITAYNNYVNDHHHTDSDYNALQNQKNQLQDTYNTFVADHHHTDEDYTNFYNISNLEDSTVLVNNQTTSQPASSYTSWNPSISYAGYVSVYVQNSSVASTHVRVIYSAYGVSFDQEIVVGVGGTAVFPILPSTLTVEVGNGNLINGATETVTITYYY